MEQATFEPECRAYGIGFSADSFIMRVMIISNYIVIIVNQVIELYVNFSSSFS